MSIIHNTAEKLGSGLAEKVGYDRDKGQILAYVFERMLNNLVFLSLLLITSSILGIAKEAIVFVIIFLPLRNNFGGWHVKSDYMCLIISVVTPLTVVFISKSININYMFIMIIYLFAYITAIKVGVVDNPNKRLKEEKKTKFKKQGIIALTFIMFIHMLFIFNGYVLISNIVSIVVLLAFFNLYFGK